MANEGPKPTGESPPTTPPADDVGSQAGAQAGFQSGFPSGFPEEREAGRGLGDFVRRAVSVGVGAAQRSKDDIMRAAGTEVRAWLEHLNVHDELVKVLSKMSVEVKAEIRFKPREDKTVASSSAAPEPVSDPGSKPERT